MLSRGELFSLFGLFMLFEACLMVTGPSKKDVIKNEILPPCQACRILVNSFKRGMELTRRGKYEGGDTAWEEENLGKYARSEVRLVEVQELLCEDIERGNTQCHALQNEHEDLFEQWWFKEQDTHPDIYPWLCIEHLKVCCPNNTYGPKCSACPGGVETPCSGHGLCKGAGTRKGNGECKCNVAYKGELCDECSVGYYPSYMDEIVPDPSQSLNITCKECHRGCEGNCRHGGSKGCEVCKPGWLFHTELGCQDIDECFEQKACTPNEFCINSEGSYQCVACHESCDGCNGDGPDMCLQCKVGYYLKDGFCTANTVWQRAMYIMLTRYVTYAGFCIATCIIFRSSATVASIIAVAVALYIGASEYTADDSNPMQLIPNFGT